MRVAGAVREAEATLMEEIPDRKSVGQRRHQAQIFVAMRYVKLKRYDTTHNKGEPPLYPGWLTFIVFVDRLVLLGVVLVVLHGPEQGELYVKGSSVLGV